MKYFLSAFNTKNENHRFVFQSTAPGQNPDVIEPEADTADESADIQEYTLEDGLTDGVRGIGKNISKINDTMNTNLPKAYEQQQQLLELGVDIPEEDMITKNEDGQYTFQGYSFGKNLLVSTTGDVDVNISFFNNGTFTGALNGDRMSSERNGGIDQIEDYVTLNNTLKKHTDTLTQSITKNSMAIAKLEGEKEKKQTEEEADKELQNMINEGIWEGRATEKE